MPCVGADFECVVCYVDTGDLVRDDREQRRLDRRALATGRRQSAKVFCVLPMETKGDEPATDAIFVEREVFVHEVDPEGEVGELDGESLNVPRPRIPAPTGLLSSRSPASTAQSSNSTRCNVS